MENISYKIYKHVHKIDDKVYIGATKQKPERRWRNGEGYKHNIYFYRVIKKDGWDSFKHIILFDHLTKEEAEEIEKELINYHHSDNNKFGYNIEKGGNLNKEISDKSRLKMSLAKKGKYSGKNHPNYGKTMSEEQKKKISLAKKGKCVGENNPNYGKHRKHSEETKQKLSNIMSGKNNPIYGKVGDDSPNHKPIICLDTLKIYNSARQAGKELNTFATNITKTCRGKQSRCCGYKFMYLEDCNNN